MTSPGALDTATTVVARAQELAQTSWADLSGPETLEIAAAVATARGLVDAALVGIAGRLDGDNVLLETGWASAKDYLTHLLGAHKGVGGGLVRAAERLAGLPTVRDALEDGRITLPQARVIADKVATLPRVPEFREQVADAMLGLATTHSLDATDLQATFGEVVRQHDPDGTLIDLDKERAKREKGAHHARHLRFAEDGLGGVKVTGYGTIEDAEAIKTTLHPLAAPVTTEPGACGGINRQPGQPMFDDDGVSTQQPCLEPGCGHDGSDPRDPGARLWDALVDACDRLAATDDLPRDHGTKPRVVVLIDHESLRQQVIDAGYAKPGQTPTGARLSATAVRRMACDAEIIPAVLGAHGQVLDVGRTQRLVTAALWLALIVRDRHCAFPGCTRMPLACDAHHITHWADGGTTALSNLVMVCRHHHTVLHHTPWVVKIDEDTRQPVWTPPPRATLDSLHGRVTYAPARPRATSPPSAA
ncbi:HNH endonuclease [Nocardioides carbamazepini]|uniref:HNH endonuclease signature motif containing protein n=1 Tax=Nocardioides carbamazepini TaxID=2854259 RepID=UPI002149AE5D|nr:HNH endonuclease signature motif containing protein [Nocardioides carbamazepini]MCR1782484.1 HNH endonuclease [Nocardioides carbamazepini]